MIYLLIFFFSVLFSSLFPTVRDTHTIRVLSDHAVSDVCIICDLDNTLIRPRGVLGSDEWFADFLKCDAPHSFPEHLRRLIHLFEEVHQRISLVRLENDSPDVLSSCAHNGARVMGMTARSCRLQERTVKQLRALSIDFSTASRLQDQNLGDDKSISSGIVFCNGGNKAEIFRELADYEGYRPSMLVVIDDRREYLEQFGQLCQEWGVPCLLYHYRGSDSYRECYTRVAAMHELRAFADDYPEIAEFALIICAAFGMVEFLHP